MIDIIHNPTTEMAIARNRMMEKLYNLSEKADKERPTKGFSTISKALSEYEGTIKRAYNDFNSGNS